MAKQVSNSKGFLIIEMSNEEAFKLGFGISEGCICMNCNNIIEEPIYYIAVLNDTMDKKCYEEWLKHSKNYPEDRIIEERNFNYYFNLLNK